MTGQPHKTFLITTGTRGDAAPFIALARRMTHAGQDVTLLSNADHEALARRHGVAFEAVSAPDWPQAGRDEAAFFEQVILPGYRSAFDRIASAADGGARPRIVARTGHWGAQFAAERFGLAFARIALQPCAIRQDGHPVSPRELSHLNAFRRAAGLPELARGSRIAEDWRDTTCLFPEWFGRPQSGWPHSGRCEDFLYLDDEDYAPPPDLAAFVAEHRPAVVSLGSGMQDTAPFQRAAERMVRDLGLPVLLLSPFAASGPANGRLMVRPSADHAWLLPRCRMVVHNGGIGTVAQAIRARIAQIVVPLMWDQPDNARRVQALGLGVGIPLTDSLPADLCAAVRYVEGALAGQ
ncbi:glycosyltransferase [Asticcacaulis solisilvae]|uniref:glycosyltransferase n=1 Tax=Asticcacaulis solisilvae TaxID=1217274 RepID=UPI003FD714B3